MNQTPFASRRWTRPAALLTATVAATLAFAQEPATMPAAPQKPSALDHVVKDIDGNDFDLASLKGKAVLIVNVASRCGFTKQYAGLQKLHERYADKGLVIIGFPANNFGAQEPGSNEEIKQFCSAKFNVTFPMMAKISVKGDDKHPVFKLLTEKETAGAFAGEVKWNFNKFLIGPDGQLAARFDSGVAPEDAKLTDAVDAALAAK
jgi:glutathione peroxidase